ncbi:hypothetical protein D3C86_1232280 [compost metagenome]
MGGWGKGFVVAISNRWKEPEKQFREWFRSQDNFGLGEVSFVQVKNDLWVANVIGQHKIYKDESGNPPIRYDAIKQGLDKTAGFAKEIGASIHMPRIGCGLAGGTWDKIEPLIEESLSSKGIAVTVYDF